MTNISMHYQVLIEKAQQTCCAKINQRTIAESNEALVLYETSHEPCIYFPKKDLINLELRKTVKTSFCPIKGNAEHYDIYYSGAIIRNAVWSYPTAINESEAISGFVGFYPEHVTVSPKPEQLEKKTNDFVADGLAIWTLLKAPLYKGLNELVEAYVEKLKEAIPALQRIRVVIQTLHPQLTGLGFFWKNGSRVEYFSVTEDFLIKSDFVNSPLKEVVDGKGGVRALLFEDSYSEKFAVLKRFKEEGITDYCALPIVFSNGHHNVITLATDAKKGFATSDLGSVFQSLANFGGLMERHIVNTNIATFLKTYLGAKTGEKLLQGQTRRGDGETIETVLMYSDLRNSTGLINQTRTEQFLDILSEYFDSIAQSIIDNGGEIVHYVGDAILAIFPKVSGGSLQVQCQKALDASRLGLAALQRVNQRQEGNQGFPLRCGISLHVGKCIFGNIGVADRMEFTAIGSCVNKVVRLEGLSQRVKSPVILSEEFVYHVKKRSFLEGGKHRLRGFDEEVKVYLPSFAMDQSLFSA